VLNVYFRDTQHFVGILLQMWFYATPIIYPYAFVTEQVARHQDLLHGWPVLWFYKFNPMVGFSNAYRAVLYDLQFPVWTDIAWPAAASFITLFLGWKLFRKLEPRLAEEL
jgi:ABC-2 type transport system permease protein